ncbi:MAG: hypothetical protein HY908_14415 [Myxococcales bacterium]|nr:hypothetical protein [Myxococcales bacterium]
MRARPCSATFPARWLPLGAACLGLAACDAGPAERLPDAVEPAITVPAPRRPAVSYYLLQVGGRCFLYTEQAEERATRREELCPRDLRDGERIRLVGHTCMREGGGPDREMPVRCPKGMIFTEHADRVDAGLVPPPGVETDAGR